MSTGPEDQRRVNTVRMTAHISHVPTLAPLAAITSERLLRADRPARLAELQRVRPARGRLVAEEHWSELRHFNHECSLLRSN